MTGESPIVCWLPRPAVGNHQPWGALEHSRCEPNCKLLSPEVGQLEANDCNLIIDQVDLMMHILFILLCF